ncbi:unnamed protein product [Lota lota]
MWNKESASNGVAANAPRQEFHCCRGSGLPWLQATRKRSNAHRRRGRNRPPPRHVRSYTPRHGKSAASVQVAVEPDTRGGKTGPGR